jgi:hypothetical protein
LFWEAGAASIGLSETGVILPAGIFMTGMNRGPTPESRQNRVSRREVLRAGVLSGAALAADTAVARAARAGGRGNRRLTEMELVHPGKVGAAAAASYDFN